MRTIPPFLFCIAAAIIAIAASSWAHAQALVGGYYVGRIGSDSATIEMQRIEQEDDTSFTALILIGGGSSISFGGAYRDGTYTINYLGYGTSSLPGTVFRRRAHVRLSGDRGTIAGIIPDSMGRASIPFEGRRVADFHLIRRPLPIEGRLYLSYPLFVAGSPRLLASVNDQILSYILPSRKRLESNGEGKGSGIDAVGKRVVRFGQILQIKTWSPELITIIADSGTDYEEGDPTHRVESLNFVREADTMRRVFLRDLFFPESGYLRRLRTIAMARADSIARRQFRSSRRGKEGGDPPREPLPQMLDTLDERADFLATFLIDPAGGLVISMPGAVEGSLVDVAIELDEIRNMIDPQGPLARFLTAISSPRR